MARSSSRIASATCVDGKQSSFSSAMTASRHAGHVLSNAACPSGVRETSDDRPSAGFGRRSAKSRSSSRRIRSDAVVTATPRRAATSFVVISFAAPIG